MTAGELVAALQMAREVGEARQAPRSEVKAGGEHAVEPAAEPATADEPAAADENVTTLPSARHTNK
jgi:hypothetical protein